MYLIFTARNAWQSPACSSPHSYQTHMGSSAVLTRPSRPIHTERVYVRLRPSTGVDALKIAPCSILSAFTSVDGRRRAWCERAGLIACVPCRRRRTSTSVYVRRRASTDVDAVGVNGPSVLRSSNSLRNASAHNEHGAYQFSPICAQTRLP